MQRCGKPVPRDKQNAVTIISLLGALRGHASLKVLIVKPWAEPRLAVGALWPEQRAKKVYTPPYAPHIICSILIFLLVSAYEFLIELFNDVSSMGNLKIYLIYRFFPQ